MKTLGNKKEDLSTPTELGFVDPSYKQTQKQLGSQFLDNTLDFLQKPEVGENVNEIVQNKNGKLLATTLVSYVVYQLEQLKNINQQLKAEKEQYLQERAEFEKMRRQRILELKDPMGALCYPLDEDERGYRASDVGKNLAKKFNITKTDAYKELPLNQRREYARFTSAKIEHADNYRTALALHDTNFEKCTFYDFDGNRIENAFIKAPDAENWTASEAVRAASRNAIVQEAMIYGMDHGYITCRMDNGKRFEPSKESIISKDEYSRHLKKMDELSEKYAGTDAKVQDEINYKYQHMTDLQKDEFIPDDLQMSDRQRRNFKVESGVYSKFMANHSDNISKTYEKGINPYRSMLGKLITSQGKVRIPSKEEVETRRNEQFMDAHPNVAAVKDTYDDIISKVTNMGKEMGSKKLFSNSKETQDESCQSV